MAESPIVVACLFVITLGVCVMTIAALVVMRDLHRTARQINAFLPVLEHAVRDARRLEGQVQHLLGRAASAMTSLEGVALKASSMAALVADRVAAWRGRAEDFLAQRFGIGNGTRAEPRRRQRTQRRS